MKPSRRELFAELGVLGVGLPSLAPSQNSAGQAQPEALAPLNRFPRMVQEYFVDRVRRAGRACAAQKDALKTEADAERYVLSVRRRIAACFGPLPEKTPLNARVTGTVERDAYRIEKVIFESRPGFLVTANLYVPKGRKLPVPGVVGSCGHSVNGKAAPSYQGFAQALARFGYVTLVFDPIGQGERFQYLGNDLKSRLGSPVREHLMAGNQQALVGEFLGTWRAWDGIRALDYLLSRREVDPKHVGITGTSGGGTMTAWLCGLERRWTMAAPSCFVTTFRSNMENELPADPEQYPPRALALRLDHDDFLAAMAPKPVVLLVNEKDYFDIRGAHEAFERLKKLYRLLGAEENIAIAVAPTYHGFSKENREGMYRWFNRITGASDAQHEPELTVEKDETLWCTSKGQCAELRSRPVFSFTAEKAKALAARRPVLSKPALERTLRAVLRLPARPGAPDYRILRHIPARGYARPEFVSYAVETEPGIQVLVYLLCQETHWSRPPVGRTRAVLYVADRSSDAELGGELLVRELADAEPESDFFACDLRGIGESRPNTCGTDPYLDPYGADYFYAGHSLMLDYPYVGQRTHDLLRVIDWLKASGHREIHLSAKGWGAVPATFAAVLTPEVAQVTLKNAPTSYSAIAQSETYDWPLSVFVPGVLATFDLPDCYAALERKRLRVI